MRRAVLAGVVAVSVLAPVPALAAPYALESTQAMVLAREIESVVHMVSQIEYMARTVAGLRFDTAADVLRGMIQVRAMMGTINPAIESVRLGDDLYRRCWPEEYGQDVTRRQLAVKVDEWRRMSEGVIQESWRVQAAAVSDQQAVAQRTGDLVAASQAAPGQTAAIQAGNQLLATLGGQLSAMHMSTIAHQRSVETVMASEVNDIDRQRAMGEAVVSDSPGWQRVMQQRQGN